MSPTPHIEPRPHRSADRKMFPAPDGSPLSRLVFAGLHTSVDLFCAFCNRGYDDEELMFFLYCRQTLLQECSRAASDGSHGAEGRGQALRRRCSRSPDVPGDRADGD